MKSRNGVTFIEIAVVIGILTIFFGTLFGVFNKYVLGNRQIVDFKHNFNVAYVLSDNGKFERVKIKAWKDWQDSDAIQVIDENGHLIYTHLMNVKLVHE